MIGSAFPISRPIVADDLVEGEETVVAFEASPEERVALARRLALPELAELTADFRLVRGQGGRIRVAGDVKARMTRICVVTLEPFETGIEEPVALEFAPEAEAEAVAEAARAAHEPAPGESLADQPDPPDPIIDGRIDLGAIAAEFLTLALDPYPRKPGASFSPPDSEASPEDSPFAALEGLKLGRDATE
jgi:uncharacterized metal-binding protein YceD (DUF177 family)